jgi:LmbE family N-acetylglucosaminyl deacetylase
VLRLTLRSGRLGGEFESQAFSFALPAFTIIRGVTFNHLASRCSGRLLLNLVLLACFAYPVAAHPQPTVPDSATLQLLLKKLTVVGNVLYVAAHPDDENTAVLAYLSLERGVRTGYLSLTRGDGGQNLIGPEQGELLGVIRTQELLQARRIDFAEQFFTRAIDFGYSKGLEETLDIWGRDEVTADIVKVIRNFRPDVIITRFPPDGGGHGHHTASAVLAVEAFTAAGDPSRYPEQLESVRPWIATRVVWNQYGWQETTASDVAGAPAMELGEYNRLLGQSYTELAGKSRTMHKSQGMGSPQGRGRQANYFRHLAGEPASGDVLDGLDLSWNRVPGGREIGEILERIYRDFNPLVPSASVPRLMQAYRMISALPPNPWSAHKEEEILEAIRGCLGLWLEAISAEPHVKPGDSIRVRITALNRSTFPLRLETAEMSPFGPSLAVSETLSYNQPVIREAVISVSENQPYTQPYWLREAGREGLFTVRERDLIGRPEADPPLRASFRLSLPEHGATLDFEVPVLYRWVDPVEGERYRYFQVLPEVSLEPQDPVVLFPSRDSRELGVTVTSTQQASSGTLSLELPEGWTSEPSRADFRLNGRGSQAELRFKLSPPAAAGRSNYRVSALVNGRRIESSILTMDYPHIPLQTVLTPTEGVLLRIEVETRGERVGYVMGSGDQVPDALRQLGYQVKVLSDAELATADLSDYDAVVIGVRAYNTRPRLRAANDRLLEYVRGGGTLVVQYQTRLGEGVAIGPYPFRISNERVSVETAPVKIDAEDHPLLSRPNRITVEDFDGWVQERGLYFADQWDPRYETPLLSADPGESQKAGGLLFARYGEGVYIYTGYAWFRQLPAGVAGAYRIVSNLVSAGKAP